MPTELLAPGTAAAISAETVLADGQTATVFLTSDSGSGIPNDSPLFIQLQRSTSAWNDLVILSGPNKLKAEVHGPVTFRVSRRAPGVYASPLGAEVTISTAAGSGSSSAVTVADGADATQGDKDDAPAASDIGSFSIVAFIKRGMQNWTTLLARIPALSTGAVPVENIKQPLVARQLAAGAASVNTPLTTTCRRISIYARAGDGRYAIGSTAQTASATAHFIAQGERLDVAVPATPNIAVMRGGVSDCTLELTELA
ncbi:hypothetical protein [Variovorax sp. AFSI2.2]|uniref:hypothetical protein n=1 Tax=Variovorax sp. AFSI2.2 TaxID=3384160 RepID=UPI003EB8B120